MSIKLFAEEVPGTTNLVQHKVETTTDEPIRSRSLKCEVGFRTLDFVGQQIREGQIGLQDASVKKMQEAPSPQRNRSGHFRC